MEYQVLYRKYRPKDFAEVMGQDHIVSVLKRQIQSGRVAHAYLFSGPRGVGKTTVARIVAKAANCTVTGSKKEAPCNACPSCEAFNAGRALNLIEIDAASNRGIDEIRELRDAVRFAPAEGRMKVYIIDEVHQLTKDAFNALLKTLEEPPPHAMFILATTELDKVLPTIVSRTQHFDFRRPRETVIRDRILAIAKAEGAKLEPDAAAAIAFVAEGAMRDAESMLGKILATGTNPIALGDVEEILGIPKREALLTLSEHIGRRHLKEAIELLNSLYYRGYEMDYLAKLLIGFFRDALLAKTTTNPDGAPEASMLPEGREALAAHLAAYSANDLARAIAALIDAAELAKRSPIPQLPLELALVEIINADQENKTA
ncbi:DNA polymerase III subunit gamma/tau [Candidatus Parcubacteria bacterium]|nr:MAG: DNA polymerase III subunit gamma/tau [Candidatus Parcubacteria bacterium]